MSKNSVYKKSGNQIFVQSAAATQDFLEPLIYAIKFSPMAGYYLEIADDFKMPDKIYGDIMSRTDRVINTFNDRTGSTGALLVGEKGSGKTLIAKNIAIECGSRHHMPTLLVNSEFHGDAFNSFIQSIDIPTVIIFDEFEKVYSRETQQQILTLLDGVFNSKKLFLITCNNEYKLDEHLVNRPSRIYYRYQYKGLDAQFVKEYCEDILIDKSKVDQVMNLHAAFGEKMNFDMLKSLIEEMNRYDETAKEVLAILNVTTSSRERTDYAVAVMIDGKAPKKLYTTELTCNPFLDSDDNDMQIRIVYDGKRLEEDASTTNVNEELPEELTKASYKEYIEANNGRRSDGQVPHWHSYVYFNESNLISMDRETHTFFYQLEMNGRVVDIKLTKKPKKEFSYYSML